MQRFIKSYANDAAIQAAVDDKSLGKPYVALDEQTGKIDWNGKDIDYSKMYFTIEVLEDKNLSVNMDSDTYYSKNGEDWVSFTSRPTIIQAKAGDIIRLKGLTNIRSYAFQEVTNKMMVYGNVMSLAYGDDFVGKNTGIELYKLFYGATGLTDASNLILPTVFRGNGYIEMFMGCKKLISAPELLGTNGKYDRMFRGCTSLKYIKCLASDLSTGFSDWVRDVPSGGTFVKKAGVTWPTGASGIPSGWTVIEE